MSKAPLSADDIRVLTRIDGRTEVPALAKLVAVAEPQVLETLRRLVRMGVVDWKDPTAPVRTSIAPEAERRPTAPPKGSESTPVVGLASEPRFEDIPLPRQLLEEPGDLPMELRKRVAWAHAQLRVWQHYEVLGLDREAEDRDIKQAYYLRSREWHPDRFKRFARLGTYGRMVDDVFRRISEAYRELSDADRRKVYDAALPRVFDPTDIESILRAEVEAERDARREEERRERRLRNNPVIQRFGKAKEFYEEALAFEKDGKFADAARTAQMAVTYDDRKPEYQELFLRVRDQAAQERIVPMLKRARHFESLTEWDDAITLYEEVVRLAPSHGDARTRLACTLLYGRRPIAEVMPHAQRAVGLLPSEPEAHYVLGRCYEELANEKGAKRHYERALELRPGYLEAQKRLKRIRWGF